MRYTKEFLEPIVRNSLSVSDVMRAVGLENFNGGSHAHVSKVIKKLNLDTSHFLGKRRNQGIEHKGGNKKLSASEILIDNRLGRKEQSCKLRRAMIESGVLEICGTCDLEPEWNGRKLVLQISHKNGNSLDNRKDNLHFQCPNCHSQTDDFAGKGSGKSRIN